MPSFIKLFGGKTALLNKYHQTQNQYKENDSTAYSFFKVFYHKEEPDPRAVKLGTSKGVVFNNIFARQIEIKDFENNDLILAMTKDHVEHLKNMSDPKHHPKIRLLLEFCKVKNSWHDEVIDPYYGQSQDISEVYHIIELAINNLFKIINPKKW